MLDDVELRELRIFLAVLVAAMRETGAQRPGAGIRAGCPRSSPGAASRAVCVGYLTALAVTGPGGFR